MVKSTTQWLRGLVRAGKAQQRSAKKIVKSLLGPPAVKARRKSTAKLKLVPLLAAPAPLKPARAKAAPKPRAARPAPPLPAPLPGKWMTAYHVSAPDAGAPAGRRMLYSFYLPDKAPSQTMLLKGRPLLVMLHGCEQDAAQFALGSRMNRLAEQKGFAVLYPQQALSTHPKRCWKWYDKATQAGGGDVRSIVAIIEQVAAKYGLDRARIYICGMSAGAAMAHIVALNHPQLIAALGLHSGPAFGAAHNAIGALGVMQHGAGVRVDGAIADVLAARPVFPPMPTMLIQGDGDRVVRPINQTQLTRQSLLLNRMPADTVVSVTLKPARRGGGRAYRLRDFSVGKKVVLRVASIEGLEHAWSGGDASLPYNAAGGPDASKMLFEFFAKQRRAPA